MVPDGATDGRKLIDTDYSPSPAEPLPFSAAGRTRRLTMSVRRYGDLMGVIVDHRPATADVLLYGADWADVAERLYGFDPTTAQRLAFVLWLRVTGRLTDD